MTVAELVRACELDLIDINVDGSNVNNNFQNLNYTPDYVRKLVVRTWTITYDMGMRLWIEV